MALKLGTATFDSAIDLRGIYNGQKKAQSWLKGNPLTLSVKLNIDNTTLQKVKSDILKAFGGVGGTVGGAIGASIAAGVSSGVAKAGAVAVRESAKIAAQQQKSTQANAEWDRRFKVNQDEADRRRQEANRQYNDRQAEASRRREQTRIEGERRRADDQAVKDTQKAGERLAATNKKTNDQILADSKRVEAEIRKDAVKARTEATLAGKGLAGVFAAGAGKSGGDSFKLYGTKAGQDFLKGIGQYEGTIGGIFNKLGPKWTAAITTALSASSPRVNAIVQSLGSSSGQVFLSQMTKGISAGGGGFAATLSKIGGTGGNSLLSALTSGLGGKLAGGLATAAAAGMAAFGGIVISKVAAISGQLVIKLGSAAVGAAIEFGKRFVSGLLNLGGSFIKVGASVAVEFMKGFGEGVLNLAGNIFSKVGDLASKTVKGALQQVDKATDVAGSIDLNSQLAERIVQNQATQRGESNIVTPGRFRKQAITLGADASLVVTPGEVAEAQKLLATGGKSASFIDSTLKSIIKLSNITGSTLKQTVGNVLDITAQIDFDKLQGTKFRTKAEAESQVIEQIFATVTSGRVNLDDLAQTTKYSRFGNGDVKSIQDQLVLNSLQANAGLRGSTAGTAASAFYENSDRLREVRGFQNLKAGNADGSQKTQLEILQETVKVYNELRDKNSAASKSLRAEVGLSDPSRYADYINQLDQDVRKALDARGLNFLKKLSNTDIGNYNGPGGSKDLALARSGVESKQLTGEVGNLAVNTVGAGKRLLQGSIESAQAAVGFALGPIVDKFYAAVGLLLEGFGNQDFWVRVGKSLEPLLGTLKQTLGKGGTSSEGLKSIGATFAENVTAGISTVATSLKNFIESGGMAILLERMREIAGIVGKVGDILFRVVASGIGLIGQIVNNPAIGNLLGFLSKGISTIASSVIPAIGKVAEVVGPFIGQIASTVGPILGSIIDTAKPIISGIASSLPGIFRALQPVFAKLAEVMPLIISALAPVFASLGRILVRVVDALPGLIDKIPGAIDAVGRVLGPIIDRIPGFIDGIGKMAIKLGDWAVNFYGFMEKLFPRMETLAGQTERLGKNLTQSNASKATANTTPGILSTLTQGFLGGLGGAGAQLTTDNGANLALLGTQLLQTVVTIASFLGQAVGFLIRMGSVILSVVLPPLNLILAGVNFILSATEGLFRAVFAIAGGVLENIGAGLTKIMDFTLGGVTKMITQGTSGLNVFSSRNAAWLSDQGTALANWVGSLNLDEHWGKLWGGFTRAASGAAKGVFEFFFGGAATAAEAPGQAAGQAAGSAVATGVQQGAAAGGGTSWVSTLVSGFIGGLSSIPGAVTNFVTAPFKLAWQGIKAVFDWYITSVTANINWAGTVLFPWLRDGITGMIGGIGSFIGATFTWLWERVTGLWGWIDTTLIKPIGTAIVGVTTAIFNGLVWAFGQVTGFWLHIAGTLFDNIKTGISSVTTAIYNGLLWAWSQVTSFAKFIYDSLILPIAGWIKSIVTDIYNRLVWAWSQVTAFWDFMKEKAGEAGKFIRNTFSNTVAYGKKIFKGFADGFKDIFGGPLKWLAEQFGAIWDVAKGLIGIGGNGAGGGGGDFASIFGGGSSSNSNVGGGALNNGNGLAKGSGETANRIAAVMRAAGIPEPVIAAALVNAVAESGLDPNAIGDGGHSVGVFQLNDAGAGAGMSVEARKNIETNTKAILADHGVAQVLAAYKAGTTDVDKLAGLWSIYVERPADAEGDKRRREELSRKYFPNNKLPSGGVGGAIAGIAGKVARVFSTGVGAGGGIISKVITSASQLLNHHDYTNKNGLYHTDINLESSDGRTRGVGIPSPAGTVSDVLWDEGGYGNYVIVKLDQGGELLFGHMDSVAVRAGQKVAAGTLLGGQGSTGGSSGDHVHVAGSTEGLVRAYVQGLFGKGSGGGSDAADGNVESPVQRIASSIANSGTGGGGGTSAGADAVAAASPVTKQKSYEKTIDIVRSLYRKPNAATSSGQNFDSKGLSFGFVDSRGVLSSQLNTASTARSLSEALAGYSTAKAEDESLAVRESKVLDKQIEAVKANLSEDKKVDALGDAKAKILKLQQSLTDAESKRGLTEEEIKLANQEFANKRKQRTESLTAQLIKNRQELGKLNDRFGISGDALTNFEKTDGSYNYLSDVKPGENTSQFERSQQDVELGINDFDTKATAITDAMGKGDTKKAESLLAALQSEVKSNNKGKIPEIYQRRILLLAISQKQYRQASQRYRGLDKDKYLSELAEKQKASFGTYLDGVERSILEKNYTILRLEDQMRALETNKNLDAKQLTLQEAKKRAASDVTIRNIKTQIDAANKDLGDLEKKQALQRQLEALEKQKEEREKNINDGSFKQIDAYLRSRGYNPTYEDVLKIYLRSKKIATEEEVTPSKLDENVRKALFEAGLFGTGAQLLNNGKTLDFPTNSVYDTLNGSNVYSGYGFGGTRFGATNINAQLRDGATLNYTGGAVNALLGDAAVTGGGGGGGTKTVRFQFDGLDETKTYSAKQIQRLEAYINDPDFVETMLDAVVQRLRYDQRTRTLIGLR